MASSSFIRSAARISLSSFRSSLPKSAFSSATSSPSRRLLSSPLLRGRIELGCVACFSLLPLHSAVADARLTSRLSADASSFRALAQVLGLFEDC